MTILHFVFGIIFIFELIAIPCIFSGASLTFTGVVWFFLSLFFTWGLIFFKKKRSLKIERAGAFPFEKGAAKYAALAFCLIFIQLFIVTTLEHRDDDDAFYVGAAVTSAESDTMFVFSPYTGNETGIYHDQNSDYLFWPIIHTRSWREDSLSIRKKNVNTSGCSYVSYRCFTFSETIHPGWSGPSFYTGSGREKRYLLRYLSPPFFISFWVI